MSTTTTNTNTLLPVVVRDSRFRAGRTLVTTGQAERAVELFATLLQEALRTYGQSSHIIETAPAYYEYGNALLRASQHANDDEQHEETEPAAAAVKLEEEGSSSNKNRLQREAAAAAAERRAAGLKKPPPESVKSEASDDDVKGKKEKGSSNKTESKAEADGTASSQEASDAAAASKKEDDISDNDDDDDDVQLALELMETAWSILDEYYQQAPSEQNKYAAWAKEQAPRCLTGIGDVLSQLKRHADAADAYLRALQYRQDELDEYLKNNASSNNKNNNDHALRFLQCRRRLVETCVLIAEELLACPADQDVVTTETNETLVKAAERVDYARGYYDKARDALQEAVLAMGEMFAKQEQTDDTARKTMQDEKENVCFVATLVMGVGTTLAELDEQQQQNDNAKKPSAKKQKR